MKIKKIDLVLLGLIGIMVGIGLAVHFPTIESMLLSGGTNNYTINLSDGVTATDYPIKKEIKKHIVDGVGALDDDDG